MKNIIITLVVVLLFSGLNLAQSTLQVNVKDCREESSAVYLSEFKVFRNGALVESIKPKHDSEHVLRKLEYGQYRIEYKTMFKQTESLKFELSERKKYSVDLCLNYIDHESDLYQPFIDRLKRGERYSIQVVSQGCFHGSDEIIEIERRLDRYYAFFEGNEKMLDANDIQAIRHFEVELNYMNSSGCTTVDSYVVKYKDKEVYIADGSCDWNGDYWLKRRLEFD